MSNAFVLAVMRAMRGKLPRPVEQDREHEKARERTDSAEDRPKHKSLDDKV